MNELLAGRYRLLRKIGVGGMASVHEAEDTSLSRRVAIKMLHPELARDDVFVARFSREARAGARLKHPGIVDVYDVVQNGDTNFIVMELIQGLSVKDRLRNGPLPADECIRIGIQIAEALHYAHSQGIVHRDVKPHNILITENGSAKLVDFGIAIARGLASITDDGTILGTVHYVAPEQVRGEPSTPQTDLYSLGAVLYEMATGHPPFEGDSAIEIATKHVNNAPMRPSQINPSISPALEQAILQALNKTPGQRPTSGAELARTLSATMDSDDRPTQVVSRPSTDIAPFATPEPRTPGLEASPPPSAVWPLILLGMLALTLVAGLVPLWATVLRSGVL